MMKKRVLTVLLAGVLAAAALTGCGGSDSGSDSGSSGSGSDGGSSSGSKEIKVAGGGAEDQ